MRILLVEDDIMIGEALVGALRDESYVVDWVENGQVALHLLNVEHYDILLLDLGLPDKDGREILKVLRVNNNLLPVLIISAKDAVEDRISGLDYGADDYLTKPFELSELMARIRAVLRRKNGRTSILLSNGTMSLDPTTREVKLLEIAHPLTKREYALLEALLTRPGAILSRSELESSLYGWGEEVESNAIEFLIYSLRQKLGNDAIKNVRGIGWMVSKTK